MSETNTATGDESAARNWAGAEALRVFYAFGGLTTVEDIAESLTIAFEAGANRESDMAERRTPTPEYEPHSDDCGACDVCDKEFGHLRKDTRDRDKRARHFAETGPACTAAEAAVSMAAYVVGWNARAEKLVELEGVLGEILVDADNYDVDFGPVFDRARDLTEALSEFNSDGSGGRAVPDLSWRVDVFCSGGWQHLASFAAQGEAYDYGNRQRCVRVWNETECVALKKGHGLSWQAPNHSRNCDGKPCQCGEVPMLGSMVQWRPDMHRCNLDIGCKESGVCYADAQGYPEQCGGRDDSAPKQGGTE